MSRLTSRENDVIRELCADAPGNKVIACRLGLSEGTTKIYMKRACDKLGITSGRAGLLLWGLRNGYGYGLATPQANVGATSLSDYSDTFHSISPL